MPATGAQRHTGREHGQGRGADRAHRGRTVRAEGLGDLTDGVREVLALGQNGHEGALGQCTVADLAALRAAHAAGLTGRVGREVVVVHVALGLHWRQRVDLLLELEHVERGDAHDLGLAALEDGRTVHARDHLDLGVERADVAQATAVDARALGEDPAAHDLLRDRLVGAGDLAVSLGGQLASLDLGRDGLLDARLQRVVGVLTLLLVGDLVDAGELALGERLDRGVDLVGVGQEHGVLLHLLRGLRGELLLRLDELREERLRGLEALRDDRLVGLRGAGLDQVPAALGRLGLDHHDRDILGAVGLRHDAAGDHEVEDGVLQLLDVRERDPLAVDEREAHAGDRAGERQARDLGRGARGVDREGVVELARGDAHDRDDDLDLVAQALDERRAQRAVDEAAGEDRVGRGASLAAEERAGDASGGVHALFDVDRQREEVEVILRVLRRARGREEHRLLVEVRGDRALRLLCEAAGLEADGALAELAVVEHGLGELDLRTLHGLSFTSDEHAANGPQPLRRRVLINSRRPPSRRPAPPERDPPPKTSRPRARFISDAGRRPLPQDSSRAPPGHGARVSVWCESACSRARDPASGRSPRGD